MFNDKLHIFTYKNTIYQSKFKLLAVFGQSRFSSTIRFSDRRHFHQQTIPRVRSSAYRGGVILTNLN
jgi:hypothetical protein